MTSFSPARENNKSKLIGNNLDYVKRNYNVFKFKSLKTKPKTKQVWFKFNLIRLSLRFKSNAELSAEREQKYYLSDK